MALSKVAKGKKRAYEESRASTSSLSSLSPPPQPTPAKRIRRVETRQCPVCDEPIPLRLIPVHCVLESQRVEEICKQVGSSEYVDLEPEEGSSSRPRRSAVNARKSLSAMNSRTNSTDTLEQSGKTIQTINRRRKQRHAKLRDMVREEEGMHGRVSRLRGIDSGEIVCPVCLTTVRGDQDVLDAHVDACLANESRRIEEERNRELVQRRAQDEETWEEVLDIEGNAGHVGNVRGTGFHTRDRHEQDIDDEVDIDGDDQAFGDVQFTEGDILGPNPAPVVEEDVEVEIEGDDDDELRREQMSLRDLVAEGKVVRRTRYGEQADDLKAKMDEVMGVGESDGMNLAILAARKRGDQTSLIFALESKVKQLESMRVSSSTSLLCRICLDPYNEPTASTGCWHTCCRECWLRCLGSTKLCPICKRITGATDLRRIYL